jgi:hypothetical protein
MMRTPRQKQREMYRFQLHRIAMALRVNPSVLKLWNTRIQLFLFKAPILRSTPLEAQSAAGEDPEKQINSQLIEDLRAFTGVRIKGPNADIYPTWRKVEAIRVFRDFQKDPEYGHLKLKWASKKPFKPELPFYVPDGLIRFVEFEEFLVDESTSRLPLFLGSQMGITPKYESCGTFRDGALHVILSKSLLSGTVNSLSLKRWVSAKNSFEMIKAWY